MPDANVKIGKATITPRIAEVLGRMQENGNEDLQMVIGNISEMKRFFISLNGSDRDPGEVLGQLGNIQYIEDYLLELMYKPKTADHENE